MKHLSVLYTLFLLFILFSFSCCIYENQREPQPTQSGKAIYDSWHTHMFTVLQGDILKALHFSYYLDTQESQKIAVEDSLFSLFKIRDLSNGVWGLFLGADKIYDINTSTTSLYHVGTEWIFKRTVSSSNHPLFSNSEIAYTITCIADSTWNISAVGDGNPFCYVSLQLQQLGPTQFDVSGEGRFGIQSLNSYYYETENESNTPVVFLSFTLEETAKSRNNFQNWSHGIISLRAYKLDGNERVTQVQMLNPSGDVYAVKVNYKGVSKVWSLSPNYYYY